MKMLHLNLERCAKVCDDAPLRGAAKSEWVYDDQTQSYHRIEKGKRVRSIYGKNLPDADKLFISRKKTAEIMVKHISAEKMQEICDAAIKKGKKPEDEILNSLNVRIAPSKATQALCAHWKETGNADLND